MHEAGTAAPLAFRRGVGKHGHELESRVLPARGNIEHIKIALRPAAPVERDRPRHLLLEGILADGLDRREAGTARHHDDRLIGVLAQIEAAQRSLEAKQVSYFQFTKNMLGEGAARGVPHMDLERGDTAGIGTRGERIAAPPAFLEQDVDVLPGEEAEILVHRQPHAQDGDVGRRLVEPLHPAGNDARAHALDFVNLDHQLGERLRLAKERIALRLVAVRQIRGVHRAVVDASLEHRTAAGAAHAGAAAVGQHVARIESRLQDGVAVRNFVGMAARFQRYALWHLGS